MIEIILFRNIVDVVFEAHGNQWFNKRVVDVNMMEEAMLINRNYHIYQASEEEIDLAAEEIHLRGVTEPCIAVKEGGILWGDEAIYFGKSPKGPIVFNAQFCYDDSNFDVTGLSKYLEEGQIALTYSHLSYCDEDHQGYYIVYTPGEMWVSTNYCHPQPFPAFPRPLDGVTMEQLVGKEVIEVEDFRVVDPPKDKVCLLFVNGKMLCREYYGEHLPYLYNAEGFQLDSYTRHLCDVAIPRENDRESGIGIKFVRDRIEDWR